MKRKRSNQSATATTAWLCRLPKDLILEILSRLPAKCLLRFRCVSRQWLDSIKDPKFTKKHLNHATRNDYTNLLLLGKKPFTQETKIFLLEGNRFDKCLQLQTKIVLHHQELGSCNGIVCFSYRFASKAVCLLNPVTREYKIVNFPWTTEFRFQKWVYGLGYDDVKDDFLLVQLSCSKKEAYLFDMLQTEEDSDKTDAVYSLNDTTLCLKGPTVSYSIWGYQPGLYFNGKLHWVGEIESSPGILRFDCKEKTFGQVPLLPVGFSSGGHITLGVLGGQLSIVSDFYVYLGTKDTELWVMKRDGEAESWVKLFVLEKNPYPQQLPTWVHCFSENGRLLITDKNGLGLYDPKKKKRSNFCCSREHLDDCRKVILVGSLVRLKTNNYVDVATEAKPSKRRKEKN